MPKMTYETAKKELSQYKCFFCHEPADRIAFYAKLYPDSGKSTKETPTLVCEHCWNDPKNMSILRQERGGQKGIYCHLFSDLGKMTEQEIGKITSKIRYERNELASRVWRKQIYQLHYLSIPPKGEKDEADRNNLQGFPVQKQT